MQGRISVTIDPKSLSFGELRQVLSELEAAERNVGRFSPVFRETVVDPFVAAAKEVGIDVAEFPRLIGRRPVADARQVPSRNRTREATERKLEKGAHPFSARSRRDGL
jgi:hypothetical protein